MEAKLFSKLKEKWGENWFFSIKSENEIPEKINFKELCLDELKYNNSIDKRKKELVLGRLTLVELIKTQKINLDVSTIQFPNTQISLSHVKGLALAAYFNKNVKGVGVDIEALNARPIKKNSAKLFLHQNELTNVDLSETNQEIFVRTWCIKEALFKATPQNNGLLVSDFEITNYSELELSKGNAQLTKRNLNYKFQSEVIEDWVIATAIAIN